MNPSHILAATIAVFPSRRRGFSFRVPLVFVAAATFLLGVIAADAGVPPVNLTTVRIGDRFGIEWQAVPDAIYKVQSTASLGADMAWVTEEPVSTKEVGPLRWMAPESMSESRFYRVLLPQPEIFSIEPSVLGTNGGTIYVVGQVLGTNGTLRLGPVNGGVERPGTGDGHIMAVDIPPMAEGVYDVSWLVGTQVVASASKLFTVTAEVQPVGIAQQLLEPPEVWPAAPSAAAFKQKIVKHYVGEMREYEKEPAKVEVPSLRIATKEPTKVEIPNLRLFSGEVQDCAVDFMIPGSGMDFIWARHYRSRTGTNTPMGNRWDHSYNIYVQPLGGDMIIHGGTGRGDRFRPSTNGTYSAPGFFCEGTLSNNVFQLTFADTGYWEFNPLDASSAAGKISRIVNCHSNALSFAYDAQGRLTTIVDTLNRTNTVAYNSSGLVQSVTDFSGRACSYQYYSNADAGGSDGDLAAVISPAVTGTPNRNDFPGGKTNRFTYSKGFADDRENHLLLSVIDGKGQISHDHVYQHNQTDLEFIRCRSLQEGTNTPINFHVVRETPAQANHFAVCRVIVNDAMGNVAECYFDSRNRLLRMLEFTGRAVPGIPTTEMGNRPTGKLRATDPDYYESQWTWNRDSLCAMYVNPRSIARQQWFESDFDGTASPRKRGDVRVVKDLACDDGADTDGDGIPDLTTRSWYFSYDPRYGSPQSQGWKGWNGTIKGNRGGIRTKGDDVGMRLSNAQVVKKVTVRGWDPKRKEEIVGEASPQVLRRKGGYSSGHFALGIDGAAVILRDPWDFLSRVICPTEDSGASKPPRLVIDPQGNRFTCILDGNGDCVRTESYARKGGAILACDYNYKDHSRLAAVTNAPDGNGYRRVDTFDYYTNGPQSGFLRQWQVDAAGPVGTITSLEYDNRGNVTRIIDPRANDWLMTYNALDQCVRMQTPTNLTARCVTDCYYDENDNQVSCVKEVRDQNDAKLTTFVGVKAFDNLNRCVDHILQVDNKHFITNRFAYDANGNVTKILSPLAVTGIDPLNVLLFQYDERNLLFREISAPGSSSSATNEYSWSASAQPLERKKLKSGVAVEISVRRYDALDRCSGDTDPMGNVTTLVFDSLDNLVYQRLDGETNDVPGGVLNRRLSECRYEYDALCRLTRVRQAFFDPVTGVSVGDGEAATTFAFAPNDACSTVTDDNNHITRFSYDTLGRLATTFDSKGGTVNRTYDACGNLLTVSSIERSDLPGAAQEFSRSFTYDSLNRCLSSHDNLNNTVQNAYNSLGQCVRSIDARGHLSGSAYDFLGRCTVSIADLDLDGVLDYVADVGHSYVWDDNSRLVFSTDDNTNTTVYTYDSLNRPTVVQRPQGSTFSCAYDEVGNLVTNIDGNGTVTAFTYDSNGRCVRKDITPGAGVAATTTREMFAYDACSRCVLASNDVSVVQFAYDSLGNCVRSSQDGLSTSCTFDAVGNCLSMTYPGGRVISYAYDALDQPTTITTPLANGAPPAALATLAYEGPGRVGRITRANNINTRLTWNGLVNPPNALGDFGWRQVSGVNHQVAPGNTIIDRRAYGYDQNQNKTLRAQIAPFVQSGPMSTNEFGYDALNRMSHAFNYSGSTVHSREYVLDGNGNRQVVTNDGSAQLYFMDATIPPGDFQADQYTVTPFGSQQHDHNGNLASLNSAAGALQYKYDYADRLVEVDSFGGGAAGPVATFAYDAVGRRISKTTYPPAPSLPVTTQFVYDGAGDLNGDGILEERVSGAIQHTFVWTCTNPDGSAARLAFFDSLGQIRYYHCDELGNTLAITDASHNVLERCEYDDYGSPTFLSSDGIPLVDSTGQPVSSSPLGNPFLFHGMFWDGETRFYVAASPGDQDPVSYFDPATGRHGSSTRASDGLVFNVVNPTAARKWRPGRPAYGTLRLQNGHAFSGDNPWSSAAIYTEWAAGPRHDDCITDCDDNDPKRHRPSCRTEFAILIRRSDASNGKVSRPVLKSFFETGDKPTQAQFATFIDSMLNISEDRYLLGLREYDPAKQYLIGDCAIYGQSLYSSKTKSTFGSVRYLTGHVTVVK